MVMLSTNLWLEMSFSHTVFSFLFWSLVDIGVLEEDPVQFYKAQFEDQFVENTHKYYTIESNEFLQGNSVSAYMIKAEERLRQEEALATQYLHPSTFNTVLFFLFSLT